MTDALLPRLALLAAAAVWQAARSRHYFHMLQLNSYRNERYAAWLSKNAPRLWFFAGLPAAVATAVALTMGPVSYTHLASAPAGWKPSTARPLPRFFRCPNISRCAPPLRWVIPP